MNAICVSICICSHHYVYANYTSYNILFCYLLPGHLTANSSAPGFNMACLKLITWNVGDLQDRTKRVAALSYLKSLWADVSVLVEICVTGQMQMALKPWIGWVYQAPYTSNSQGIAILIAKTAHFQFHTLRLDPQGRFLFLHVTSFGLELLLIAFFIPPPFRLAVLPL